MSISLNIRKWCDGADVDGNACDELRVLADRIDREMMELPKDADGEPIEVGDTVYCDDDPEQLIVDSFDDPGCVYITLAKSPDGILYTIEPSRLSHDEPPDSLERIADELKGAEKWCDQNGDYDTGLVSITESKLREWSDRIRKLAAKEGEASGQGRVPRRERKESKC